MKNWSKLALPIGMGIAAGIMHYQVLVPRLTPHTYVQVNRDLKPGDIFQDNCLTRIDMPGEFTRLSKTLVPWEHRRVLAGCHATRALSTGDIVLFSDTSDYVLATRRNEVAHAVELNQGMVTPGSFQVGAALRFRMSRPDRSKADKHDVQDKPRMRWDAATKSWVPVWPNKGRTLGPLRILALGADTIHDGRINSRDSYSPCNVTLAFPCDPASGELVPWAERLLDALMKKSDESVVAVEVCEPAEGDSAEPAAGLATTREAPRTLSGTP